MLGVVLEDKATLLLSVDRLYKGIFFGEKDKATQHCTFFSLTVYIIENAFVDPQIDIGIT